MKGAMAAFLMNSLVLSGVCAIVFKHLIVVDLFDDMSYCIEDLLITQYFFCGIHEKHIHTFDGKVVLLFSIAFSDPSFEKIALDGSFEEFLRYGYHDPVEVVPRIGGEKITHTLYAAVFPFGKKH